MFLNLDKKAQSNTFWIIIGAVIALIVMIVLLLMFTGKTNILEQGLVDCEAKGGTCEFTDCPKGMIKQNFFSCKESNYPDNVCCVGTGTACTVVTDCGEGENCVSGYCQ